MVNIISKVDEVSNLSQHAKGSLLTFAFDKTKIEKAFNLGIFDEATKGMLFTICDNKLLLAHNKTSIIDFFDIVGRVKVGLESFVKGVRLGTYSGEHLVTSKVFLPTVTQSVSNNELDYFYRIGAWEQTPVQPAFKAVEMPSNAYVFLCSSDFDLNILRGKKDVSSVTDTEIRTTGGRVYNIFRID